MPAPSAGSSRIDNPCLAGFRPTARNSSASCSPSSIERSASKRPHRAPPRRSAPATKCRPRPSAPRRRRGRPPPRRSRSFAPTPAGTSARRGCRGSVRPRLHSAAADPWPWACRRPRPARGWCKPIRPVGIGDPSDPGTLVSSQRSSAYSAKMSLWVEAGRHAARARREQAGGWSSERGRRLRPSASVRRRNRPAGDGRRPQRGYWRACCRRGPRAAGGACSTASAISANRRRRRPDALASPHGIERDRRPRSLPSTVSRDRPTTCPWRVPGDVGGPASPVNGFPVPVVRRAGRRCWCGYSARPAS